MKIKTVDYNLIDKMGQDGDYDMLYLQHRNCNTGDPIWFLANYWHTNGMVPTLKTVLVTPIHKLTNC